MELLEKNRHFLRLYTEELENRLGQGPLVDWRYSQFVALAEAIQGQSGVMVSHTTLIRILQKHSFKRSPQPATLDALAQYLGYPDWAGFCQSASAPPPVTEAVIPAPTPARPPFQRRWSWPAVGGIMTLLALTGLAWAYFPSFLNRSQPQGELTCLNPVGVYPHHFSFTYQTSAAKPYLVFAPRSFYFPHHTRVTPTQKPHPVKDPIYLSPQDTFFSVIKSLNPESYWVYLMDGQKALDTVSVFVRSPGWMIDLRTFNTTPGRSVKDLFQPTSSGLLSPSPSLLDQFLANEGERVLTQMTYCDSFRVDANTFRLHTRLSQGAIRYPTECEYIRVKIQTSQGMIEIPLSREGCQNELHVFASDYYTHARHTALFQLATELHTWHDLTIESRDHHVRVHLDGQPVLDLPYSRRLGEIMGIKYTFMGSGQVDFVRIFDHNDSLVWQDEFEPAA